MERGFWVPCGYLPLSIRELNDPVGRGFIELIRVNCVQWPKKNSIVRIESDWVLGLHFFSRIRSISKIKSQVVRSPMVPIWWSFLRCFPMAENGVHQRANVNDGWCSWRILHRTDHTSNCTHDDTYDDNNTLLRFSLILLFNCKSSESRSYWTSP